MAQRDIYAFDCGTTNWRIYRLSYEEMDEGAGTRPIRLLGDPQCVALRAFAGRHLPAALLLNEQGQVQGYGDNAFEMAHDPALRSYLRDSFKLCIGNRQPAVQRDLLRRHTHEAALSYTRLLLSLVLDWLVEEKLGSFSDDQRFFFAHPVHWGHQGDDGVIAGEVLADFAQTVRGCFPAPIRHHVYFVREPDAALLSLSQLGQLSAGDHYTLVVDAGGGTTDFVAGQWTNGRLRDVRSYGEPLGGGIFDNDLAQYVAEVMSVPAPCREEMWTELRHYGRQLKESLSRQLRMSDREPVTLKITLELPGETGVPAFLSQRLRFSREDFEQRTRQTVDDFERLVLKAVLKMDLKVSDMGEVVLVGGGSNLYLVPKLLKEVFGEAVPVIYGDPPEETIVRGAALWPLRPGLVAVSAPPPSAPPPPGIVETPDSKALEGVSEEVANGAKSKLETVRASVAVTAGDQATAGPAPVTAAPVGVPVAGKAEFDLVMTGFGENKVNVIRVVREITGLNLAEAKEIVETSGSKVLEAVSKEVANGAQSKLEAAGAAVEVSRADQPPDTTSQPIGHDDNKVPASQSISTPSTVLYVFGEEVRGFFRQFWTTRMFSSVAFSPDGRLLASGTRNNSVKLWEIASGKEIRTRTEHSGAVGSVVFSPDGRLLASGSNDKTIKLWEIASGKKIRTLTGHGGGVDSVAFSPDGRLLVSRSHSDKSIKLWALPSARLIRTLTWHKSFAGKIALSPDGRLLASAGSDGIKLWEIDSDFEEASTLTNDLWMDIAFSPDGRYLASSAFGGGTITIWELVMLSGHKIKIIKRNSDSEKSAILSVRFSPDGRLLASGSGDNTITLWDIASGKEIRTLTGHAGSVVEVVFSPDGLLLASVSDDSTIRLWR